MPLQCWCERGAAPRADVAVEAAEVEAGVRADAQVGVRGQQGGARGRVRAAAARHDLRGRAAVLRS